MNINVSKRLPWAETVVHGRRYIRAVFEKGCLQKFIDRKIVINSRLLNRSARFSPKEKLCISTSCLTSFRQLFDLIKFQLQDSAWDQLNPVTLHKFTLWVTLFIRDGKREPFTQAPNFFRASYTRKAGHTIAFKKPTTPIQKPVACIM